MERIKNKMTTKQQLIKGLVELLDILDSTPVVRAKALEDDEIIPLYNVQNSTTLPKRDVLTTSPYTDNHLRDMFTLKPLDEIKSIYK